MRRRCSYASGVAGLRLRFAGIVGEPGRMRACHAAERARRGGDLGAGASGASGSTVGGFGFAMPVGYSHPRNRARAATLLHVATLCHREADTHDDQQGIARA